MSKLDDIWRAKSDDEVLEAGRSLAEYSPEGEAAIRAELRERGFPNPPVLVREPLAGIAGEQHVKREFRREAQGLLIINVMAGMGITAYYIWGFPTASEFQGRVIERIWGVPSSMAPSVRLTFSALCIMYVLLAACGFAASKVPRLQLDLILGFLGWSVAWARFSYQAEQAMLRGVIGVIGALWRSE